MDLDKEPELALGTAAALGVGTDSAVHVGNADSADILVYLGIQVCLGMADAGNQGDPVDPVFLAYLGMVAVDGPDLAVQEPVVAGGQDLVAQESVAADDQDQGGQGLDGRDPVYLGQDHVVVDQGCQDRDDLGQDRVAVDQEFQD